MLGTLAAFKSRSGDQDFILSRHLAVGECRYRQESGINLAAGEGTERSFIQLHPK